MNKDNFFKVVVVVVIALISLKGLPTNSKPIIRSECNKEDTCLKENKDRLTPKQLCEYCSLLAPLGRELIRNNKTGLFKPIAVFVCTFLNITQETICEQAIDLFEGAVINVVNETTLTDNELCSVFIGCDPVTNPVLVWNITLPNVPKPPIIPPNPPKPGSPTLRILQLTDIHVDFEYQPGALAECGQPLCCRNSSKLSNANISDDKKAGYWGDYRNCDVPIWTVENMLDHISKNEQFDFVYWTGDLPPHNVWNQSKSDQISALQYLTNLFLKYFPGKIICPSLGNHEATPVNLYPPPYVKGDNITWLYSELARDWVKTGLPSSLSDDIAKGAFYSLYLAPKLRLISLNMNYCPSGNFWLYINSTDPLGQLAWLANMLQESENKGEKVHIIGHIHPSSCLDSFSKVYYNIVNRYESTISGQFFGHSHSDSFEMFYDLNNISRAVGIAYISGSVTTYSYLNPSYRIYTIDGDYPQSSYQVLDHETYFMNLTEANLYGKPNWQKEYSAKDDFHLSALYPQNWANLLDEMLKDLNGPLVDKLLKYYTKSVDTNSKCDENCRKGFVCGFKQGRSDSFIPC